MSAARAPVRIGVVAAGDATRRPRLLNALELAYPVSFEAREAGAWRGLDGVIALGEKAARAIGDAPARLPCLVACGEELQGEAINEESQGEAIDGSEESHREAIAAYDGSPAGAPVALDLSADRRLARPLRGARLSESHAAGFAAPPRGDVLARIDGAPAWVRRSARGGPVDLIAVAPAELDEGEALRERLRPGRSLALLALAHFLCERTSGRRWEPPSPRAGFVIDDPNLHWPSYGSVRYAALRHHAEAHGYHLSVAMVPLDGWLVHRSVARLFREGRRQLSVCVHGNDHSGPELGRPRSRAEAVVPAAQSLRRMTAFERRSGVPFSRVMVPPHERLSEHAARALRACGFEAVCTTRPYPWLATTPDVPWLTRPADAGPLVGWRSTDVVAGGLPVLLRSGFGHPRDDLVLRAFLGQPLILYGHHDDLADGLDVLASASADVGRVGDVSWGSLSEIVRSSVETRRDGETLELRLGARQVSVAVPPGVERLALDVSTLGLPPDAPIHVGDESATTADKAIEVRAGDRVGLSVAEQAPAQPPRPRPRVWPLARRLAGEGRDRLAGLRVAPSFRPLRRNEQ